MELRGYCNAVRDVERIIEKMVEKRQAEKIKDSSKPFALPIGKDIPNEKNLIQSDNHVRIYQVYIGTNPLTATRVNIRFWYDWRQEVNKASIKVSSQGMELLIRQSPQLLSKDLIESTNLEISHNGISM